MALNFGLYLFLDVVIIVLYLLGQDCCLFFFGDRRPRSREARDHPERISESESPHGNTARSLVSDIGLGSFVLSASSLVGN